MRKTALLILLLVLASLIGKVVIAHELNPAVIKKLTGEVVANEHEHEEEMSEADPRHQSRTFYSFPEWYIVYSAQEYGEFVQAGGRPSQYPYGASIGQMWESWSQAEAAAGEAPDATTNTILWTIALSYSVETGIIGLYENTIGVLSQFLHLNYKTTEDMYIDAQAVRYGEFLNQTPWYEFPYLATLGGLWQTYGWSSLSPRGIERRIAFTVGYGLKSVYAGIIKFLSQTNYEGGAGQTTTVTVVADESILPVLNTMDDLTPQVEENMFRVDFPRYRAFTAPAVALALAGAEFQSIAGNNTITLSIVASTTPACMAVTDATIFSLPLVSSDILARYVLVTPVSNLAALIRDLDACGLSVEHIYDY